MSLKKYKRIELAENQLRTAIGLFVSDGDKFSVITLAGSADVILCRLVSNLGEENFTEYSLKEMSCSPSDRIIKESHGREINNTLFINDMKHMDTTEDGYIEIDADGCALGAILKALANYLIIVGRDNELVQGFLAWVRLNLDPQIYNIYCDPNWMPST